jgi:hypothetical protein
MYTNAEQDSLQTISTYLERGESANVPLVADLLSRDDKRQLEAQAQCGLHVE